MFCISEMLKNGLMCCWECLFEFWTR